MVCRYAYPLNKPEFIYWDLYFKITERHHTVICIVVPSAVEKENNHKFKQLTNGGCGSLYLLVEGVG